MGFEMSYCSTWLFQKMAACWLSKTWKYQNKNSAEHQSVRSNPFLSETMKRQWAPYQHIWTLDQSGGAADTAITRAMLLAKNHLFKMKRYSDLPKLPALRLLPLSGHWASTLIAVGWPGNVCSYLRPTAMLNQQPQRSAAAVRASYYSGSERCLHIWMH